MKHMFKLFGRLLPVLLLVAFFMVACTGSEAETAKSMEQIHKENGIPVTVEAPGLKHFSKYKTFFGKFKGNKETTVGSMIGGRIVKINAKPGDTVKKDQVVIEFPEDAPAAQYQQAKSAYLNTKKTYERMKALYEKGEIAQADFDGIKTKYTVDKTNFETMQDMLKLEAPYKGVITEVYVHEGDNVDMKKPLFTIAQLNKMIIRVWLSDEERMEIKPGMCAEARVGSNSFRGEVSELSMGVDPMKQAFYADLIFDNDNGKILPGLTADVRICLYENEEAITVPRNLVKQQDNEHYVFIADGDKAKMQKVTIKEASGVMYEISSGLNADSPLIVKGTGRLLDGVKINVVK